MSSHSVEIPAVLICFPRVQHKEVWLAQGGVSVSVGSHTGVCQCLSHPSSQRTQAVGMRGSSPIQPLGTSQLSCQERYMQEQFVTVVGDVCDLPRFPCHWQRASS